MKRMTACPTQVWAHSLLGCALGVRSEPSIHIKSSSHYHPNIRPVFASGPSQPMAVFSDNAFRVPADRFSSEWVRLSSITQDYGSILRDYQARDVAVRGYLPSKSGCAWRTAVHLPQLGNRPDNLLTVMLNIGDQDATVELIREGVTLVERRKCEKSDGTTRFAFDTQCMLPLNNQSHGKAKLRIVVTDGFLGEVSEDWLVWLPKTKAAKAGNE